MRIRILFSKAGPMQYVGHLDLHRSWERTFRRACLPLSYSLGFHPQPRLNLACALPLGFTSQCELLDAWLDEDLPVEQLKDALSGAIPPGLSVHTVEQVDIHAPALQSQVESAVYVITFLDEIPDLEARLDKILSSPQLPRQRRGKLYDLRPLIEKLDLIGPGDTGCSRLCAQLSVREAATGRPEEVLDELGIKFEDTHVHREKLIFHV